MNAITLQNQNVDLAQAVFIQNDQIKTNSLKVAEYFGKRHDHVLRKIESFFDTHEHNLKIEGMLRDPNFGGTQTNLYDFASANFSAHVQTIQAGAVQRESKYYEMNKDGWMFLVMGFTGEKAAQIKIAYINAFNHMAAILHNQHIQGNQFKVGSTVQLKIGSPSLYINQLIYSDQGYLEHAEIVWFKNRLHKEIVPIAALTIDHSSLIRNQILEDFWSNIYDFGIEKLNHSDKVHTIALNLNQVYQAIDALPIKAELTAALIAGSPHHPRFMFGNHAIRSKFTKKTVKCWIFTAPKNIIEHQEIDE